MAGERNSQRYAFTARAKALGAESILAALALLSWLNLASASAAERAHGLLEIRIKDHRDAIGDFTRLDITIDKILISPAPGLSFWQTGWKELSPANDVVDLTKHTGKNTARVFRSNIAPGSFDGFHLKLKSIDGALKRTQKTPQVKNTVAPAKLSFEVQANSETILIIDLAVVDFSDHPPRGYELALHGYELYTNGKLIDKIPPG